MISTDFAPNESWDDAWQSIKLLFQPWRWTTGKEQKIVNQQISQMFASENVRFFLSGRSALYFLLKSLALPANSTVMVQGFTCEAVVLPIIANHLTPLYVDIEIYTFSMDSMDFLHKLSDECKVLILQHTYGLTPKYRQQIINYAIERKMIIIEDLAHGWNKEQNQIANIKGQNHYFLLSFGRSKALSSIFGAAVVSNDHPIADKLTKIQRKIRYPKKTFILQTLLYKPLSALIKLFYDIHLGKLIHKFSNLLHLFIPEITPQEKLGKYNIVFNKNYPNALAILLLEQLKKFDQTQQKRTNTVNYYNDMLKKFKLHRSIPSQGLIRYPLLTKNRDTLLKKASQKRIYLGDWYSQPIAPRGFNLAKAHYHYGSCPVAEKVCRQIINLPTNISLKQAQQTIQTLSDVYFN